MPCSTPRSVSALLILVFLLMAAAESGARERGRDPFREIPRMYEKEGPIVAGPARLGGFIGRGIGTLVGVPMVVLAAPLSLVTLGGVSPFFPVSLGRDIGGVLGPHFGGMPAYIPKNLLMDAPAAVYHAVAGDAEPAT